MSSLPKDFSRFLQQQGLSGVSIKNYTADVNKFIKWLEATADGPVAAHYIRKNHIDQYLASLETEGVAESTIKRYTAVLNRFYSWIHPTQVRKETTPPLARYKPRKRGAPRKASSGRGLSQPDLAQVMEQMKAQESPFAKLASIPMPIAAISGITIVVMFGIAFVSINHLYSLFAGQRTTSTLPAEFATVPGDVFEDLQRGRVLTAQTEGGVLEFGTNVGTGSAALAVDKSDAFVGGFALDESEYITIPESLLLDTAYGRVLAAATSSGVLEINTDTEIAATLTVTGDGTYGGLVTALGGIQTQNADINAGTGELTASNVIYDVLAGTNITITGDAQSPVINADTAGIDTIIGTSGRITVSTAADPVLDISTDYAGQTSISTLGTITNGTWQGTEIDVVYGGTGLTSVASGQLLYGTGTDTLGTRTLAAGTNLTLTDSGTALTYATSLTPTFNYITSTATSSGIATTQYGGDYITTTATSSGFSFNVGDGGAFRFSDGTNTLFQILDGNEFGVASLSGKQNVGDPACQPGQIYFNEAGSVFKACTAENTWTTIADENGPVTFHPASADSWGDANPGIWLDEIGAGSPDLFRLQVGGSSRFVVPNDGGFQSAVGGAGTAYLNLSSTGDFEIQDAGTPFVSFLDNGTVTFDGASTFNTDVNLVMDGAENVTLTNAAATADQLALTVGGVTTDAVDGIVVDFTQADDADGTDTNAALFVDVTSSSGDADTLYGVRIDAITGGAATETALDIGAGWDTAINIGGGSIVTAGGYTQSGASQNTFTGNVDATNGLDVTNADLTVGGANFAVDDATGDITSLGDATIGGRITFENSEYISNETDDLIIFSGSGGSDDTDLVFNLDGVAPVIYSQSDSAIRIDDDLHFVGDQNITTTSGNLSIVPNGILTIDTSSVLNVGTGTATAINFGNASLDSFTVITNGSGDSEVVLPAQSISSTEVLNESLDTNDFAATLTFSDGDFIDLGSIQPTGGINEGFRLPQVTGAIPSPASGEGYLAYRDDANTVEYFDGSSWITIAAQTPLWADDGTITHLISNTDDLSVGGITLASPFSVDVDTNTARIGDGVTTNANLSMYSSTADTGTLTYNTSDTFQFSGGDVLIDQALEVTAITTLSDDLIVGGTTLASPFSVDESANTVRIGDAATGNATLALYASTGQTGSLLFNTSDQFQFTGGDVRMDQDLTVLDDTTLGNAATDSITLTGSIATNVNFLDSGVGTDRSIAGSDATGGNSAGGDLTVRAGNATGVGQGGDLTLAPGLAGGGGTGGDVVFQTGDTVLATRFTIGNDGTLTQSGTGQVTFSGNVDATSGLDVSGGNLTLTAANDIVLSSGALDTTGGVLNIADTNASSIAMGHASLGSLTVVTDGTGDSEVVLPDQSISSTEILDDTVATSDLAASLVFADGDFIDLASIINSAGVNEGFRLPQSSSALGNPSSGEGYIAYRSDSNNIQFYDGTQWVTLASFTPLWTDDGTISYLIDTADDLAVGGTTLNSPFSVDVSANTVRVGSGATVDAVLQLYAQDNDTGNLTYNVNDQFQFSGGDVLIDQDFRVTQTTTLDDDLYVGATGLAAPFSVDESLNTVRVGDGSGTNATITMYASDNDVGSFLYNTNDSFEFQGGNVQVDQNLTVQEDTTFGDATTDTITVTGSFNSNLNFLDADNQNYTFAGADAVTGSGNAGDLTIRAGSGGATTGNGGDLVLAGGTVTSGTAGYIAFQTDNTERLRIENDGDLFFERGSEDLTVQISAPSGASRVATIPALTADDTFVFEVQTQTLSNKSLASPSITGSPTAAGASWTDLGSVSTIDINGGTIDGTSIGVTTPASGTFTTLSSSGVTTIGNGTSTVAIDSSDWDITAAGVGTGFDSWTVDNLIIDGSNIGRTSDPDLLNFANAILTVNGDVRLANNSNIEVGGLTGVAYNAISDGGGSASFASTDNDLYIEDILEVDGTVYIGGKPLSASALWENESNVFHPIDEYAGVVDLTIGGEATSSADIYFSSAGAAVFNEQSNSVNFRVEGNNDPDLIFADGSSDTVTIGAQLELGKLGVRGDQDEIQFRVRGNSTQNANLMVIEQNSGADALSVSNAGLTSTADLTLGLNDTTATISTSDVDEDLTIDPNGTGDIYFNGSTYVLTDSGDFTIGGRQTFENGEYIQNETDDIFAFVGASGVDDTDLYLNLDGSYPILYSNTDTTIGIDDDLQFIGATNISNTSGNLSISAATDLSIDSTSDVNIGPTYAAFITIGSSTLNSVTIDTDGTGDGELILPDSSVSSLEIVNDSLTPTDFAATLTFTDGDFLDLASIVPSSSINEGLRLPQSSGALGEPGSGEGYLAYRTDTNTIQYYDGADWQSVASSTPIWTDDGTITYLISATDDMAVGGTSLAAPFSVDVSANAVRIGDGTVAGNGRLTMYASDTDQGTIIFNTNDQFEFNGADVLVDQDFRVNGNTTLDDDVYIGATTLAAPFSVDVSTNTVRLGDGTASGDATLLMFSSGGDVGTLAYTTSDEFNFQGGNIRTAGIIVEGNTTLGDQVTDTVTVTGSLNSNVNFLDQNNTSYTVAGADAGTATGNAGNLTIRAGSGGSTSGSGGDLILSAGTVTSGTPGDLNLRTNNVDRLVIQGDGTFRFEEGVNDFILDVNAPTGADRTGTIPTLSSNDTFVFESLSQTLTSKTLISPTISGSPTAVGAAWADLGSVATIDINGGTIDGTAIGGSTPSSGAFTTLSSTGVTTIGNGSSTVAIDSNDWDITSIGVGTGFNSWTVDNVIIDGNDIGLVSDTDLLSFTDSNLTVNGDVTITGGDITGAAGAALDLGEQNSGDVTVTGDLILADDAFIGIGGSAARIVFDSTPTPDQIDILSASLDMNNNIITNIGNAATDFDTNGGLTLAADLAVNGGDLTTTDSTFNLVNNTPTTVNFAGNAGAISIGAVTGTTTVNHNLTVAGVFTANGQANIGDGGDTVAINSSDWDITSTGVGTGFDSWTVDNLIINGNNIGTLTDQDLIVFADNLLTLNGGLTMSGTLDANGQVDLGDGGDAVAVSGTTVTISANGSTNDITMNLVDNNTDAFDLQEGTNNYININTLDGSEEIELGNTVTNPDITLIGSGAFNCTDCIDFDDLSDNMSVDAATTISLDANNFAINMNSTGEFILQDNGGDIFRADDSTGTMTFSDDVDLQFAGAENLTISNVSVTSGADIVALNMTVPDSTSADAMHISITDNSASSGNVRGLVVETGNGAATLDSAIAINHTDTGQAMTAGIEITGDPSTAITIALDVDDPEIVTALSAGANDLTGTNWSINGSTGSLTLTGDAAVNGGDLTSTAGTLNINAGGNVDVQDALNADSITTDTGGVTIAAGQSYTGAGTVTLSSGGAAGLTLDSASGTINLSTNDDLAASGDVDLTFAGTENLAMTSDLAGTVNVTSIVTTPSNTAGTTRGIFLQQTNSANTNGLDSAIVVDNADLNLAIGTAIQITDSGGGGYTTILDTPTTDISGTGDISVPAGTGLDTNAIGTLNLGAGLANAISVGTSGMTTTVNGSLTVTETLTGTGEVVLGDGGDNVTIDSADWDITSTGVGTGFDSWTVDSLILNGITIGLTTDTDLLSLADNALTVNGDMTLTGGDITGAGGAAIDIGEANAGDITLTGDVIVGEDAFVGLVSNWSAVRF